MNDPAYQEVLVGRVFVILGCKNSEMSEDQWRYRPRAVFQANNIQARSGRSVYEIFEDVSNTPASLAAARLAFGVALLKGMIATYRDAFQAYLQAILDVDPDIINLVEIPREWWLAEWYYDVEKTRPKYHRPAFPLKYALSGHPKSGNIWEAHTDAKLIILGCKKVESWCGIFVHIDGSIRVFYVDDFMVVATKVDAYKHWDARGREMEFQEEGAPIVRYLGATYRFDDYNESLPSQPRTVATKMSGYLLHLVKRFQKDHEVNLRNVNNSIPY